MTHAIHPCPLCAGHSELKHPLGEGWWQVICNVCGCRTGETRKLSRDEVVAKWNERPGTHAQRSLAFRLDHPALGIELSIFEPDADWISRGWTVTPLYASPAPSWQPIEVQKITADALSATERQGAAK
jgi:hypothetical protein